MRKWLTLLLIVLVSLCATCAAAETHTSGEWEYELGEDGTATLLEYLGASPELVIPAEIDGHRVSCVGDREDDWGIVPEEMWQTVTKVTIPEGVTALGFCPFAYCEKLARVELPATMTAIGYGAFYRCVELTDLVVAEDNPVYVMHGDILCEREGMRLVFDPAMYVAEHYTIPEGVMGIADMVFMVNENLVSLTLPETVTSIGV